MKEAHPSLFNFLQILLSAEEMLIVELPLLIEHATNDTLKASLFFHLSETLQHKVKVEFIFKQYNIIPDQPKNEHLTSILKKGKKKIKGFSKGTFLDTAIINTLLEVEEYEIATYKNAAKLAEEQGFIAVAAIMKTIFDEEIKALSNLILLAKK